MFAGLQPKKMEALEMWSRLNAFVWLPITQIWGFEIATSNCSQVEAFWWRRLEESTAARLT
jgi:hypothetical protein